MDSSYFSTSQQPSSTSFNILSTPPTSSKTPDSSPSLISLNLTTILESDVWGVQDFQNELQQIDQLVQKCDTIKLRLQKIESTVGSTISSSMLFVLFQKHRQKSLKKQILTTIDVIIPKIIYVEESIRIWFEAIVMKKWSIRHDTLQHFQQIDAVIKIYKRYLSENIEMFNDCNAEIISIKDYIRHRKQEIAFIDAISMLKEFELWRISNPDTSFGQLENLDLDTVDHMPLIDESFRPSRLLSIETRQSSSQWDQSVNTKPSTQYENFREEISEQLSTANHVLSRLKSLSTEIKKSQKRLLKKLSYIKELKYDLKSQCGSQTYTSDSWDDEDDLLLAANTAKDQNSSLSQRDIRKILQQDCYDSEAVTHDLHPRCALENFLPVISSPQNVVQMLESLQNKGKQSLERVISQKNELILLKSELTTDEDGPSKPSPIIAVSPVYDIIWGMYCVPAPQVSCGEDEDLFYCRSLVKSREFPIQAFTNNVISTDHISPIDNVHQPCQLSHLSALVNKEQLDLLRALRLIIESLPSSANASMQSIFLKEFTIAELGTLQAQLRADTLRIHTIKDKFTPTWASDHPSSILIESAIPDDTSDRFSTDSRDSRIRRSRTESKSFSRPRSRANSWSSRRDSQSSLLGRLTSTVLSIFDNQEMLYTPSNTVKPESPSGCGIIWEGKSLHKGSQYYHETAVGYYAAIGLLGAIAVFSRSLTYQDLLSAFALRDMLSTDHGVHLPLLVYSSESNTFIGLEPKLQQIVLVEFLNECSPHPCCCFDSSCTYPSLPYTAPSSMRINLPFYPDLSTTQQVRLHGAWGCASNFLTQIYPVSQPMYSHEIETYLFHGLREAVYSANVEAANSIIYAAAYCLFKSPNFASLSRPRKFSHGSGPVLTPISGRERQDTYVSFKDVPISSSSPAKELPSDEINSNTTQIYPLEPLVRTVYRLVDLYNGQVPHLQLLVPLGILRVIQASVNKQTSARLDEACLALSRWIDLSNSMAFRVLGSTHTTVAEAQALGTIYPLSVPGTGNGRETLISEVQETKDQRLSISEKQKALEQTKQRKVPLIASVAVSCRVELYHDLLSAQISATSGKACSETIFSSDADFIHIDDQRPSLQRSSEYVFTPDEQIVLLEILSSLVVSLGNEVDQTSKSRSSKDNSNALQTVRQNIRFHVLQYLLGLDERWNFTHTVAICRTILSLIEKYRPLLAENSLNSCAMLPFHIVGSPSQLLTPSTLNILARGLPKTLFGRNCTVRYSLERDGASVMTLIHLSESAPYSGCLLVVQDTAGYVFGGYLDGQISGHFREYFGTGLCFVFRALPNTKIYTWSKKNEYFFCYGNDFIGMGGGSGFAFVLDDDLRAGTSSVSATFDNDILSFTSLFECKQVELLTFE